jgi:succinate dehydrogenase / fumarate reductase cytochrome b subunit
MEQVSRSNFWFKRIHSFVGIVPLGIFIIFHFIFHSFSHQGPAAYDGRIDWLYSLPLHAVAAIFLVYIPLLYHSIAGTIITLKARPNWPQYPYFGNFKFVIQRLTALGLIVFIIAHLVKARFVEFFFHERISWLHEASALRWDSAHYNPLSFPSYILGIVAISFHLANGLWTFGITWGITPGPRSQRWSARFSIFVFIALTLLGLYALLGFFRGSLPIGD